MSDAPIDYLELWFQALAEPVGIIVASSDRHRLMNKLYAARKDYAEAQGDSALADLSICMSPTAQDELWIVHKTVKVPSDAD